MSGFSQDELIKSWVWNNYDYPLAQFVEDYPPPQVVYVEEGYYGMKESISFGSGQVVTLHAVRSIRKLVGEDSSGKPFTLSLDCSVKVHVSPLGDAFKCNNIQADKLKLVFPRIKYIRVLGGYYNNENERSRLNLTM